MAPETKRIIGDVKNEKDPNRVAENARWTARNLASKNPSTLGASRWNSGGQQWSLHTTRDEIFAKMKNVEGGKAPSDGVRFDRVRAARNKVYQDMYTGGCGINEVAASAINVEYYIDARLWGDHVQSHTDEEFPWQWPDVFREDPGYADFVSNSQSTSQRRDQWSASVMQEDDVRRAQRAKDQAETEKKMQAEGKDWADMAAPLVENFTPTQGDENMNRVRGESTFAVHQATPAAESAKKEEEKAGPGKAEPEKTEPQATPWTPEVMTELYEEVFGQGAARLDGMGGFELPFEEKFVGVLKNSTIAEAQRLFPSSLEIQPKTLGWGRVKLVLRFASWVLRGPRLSPLHKHSLVWAWCILLKYKEGLIQQASDAEAAAEPSVFPEIHEGLRKVMEEWTERHAVEQADLSVVDQTWGLDAQADRASLEDEDAKGLLYETVSHLMKKTSDQDDVARAHRVVDWATKGHKKLGPASRTRAYMAIEAMNRYCASTPGEENLGMIAQRMMSGVHASASRLKTRASEAAQSS